MLAGRHRAGAPGRRQAGLKLLVGSEMTTLDGLKLVFLAQNREGYGNLSALITLFGGADKGITACIAMTSMPSRPTARFLIAWCSGCRERGRADEGRWLAERFPGRLWIAVELHAGPDDTARLAGLQELASVCQLPLVAAGRCAYACQGAPPGTGRADRGAPEDHGFRGGLCALSQWRAPFAQPSAPVRLYPPALLAESLAIAQRCSFSLDELRYEYPEEIAPAGHTPTSWLRHETERGLRWRYPAGEPPDVRQRIEHELALIAELRYEAYF